MKSLYGRPSLAAPFPRPQTFFLMRSRILTNRLSITMLISLCLLVGDSSIPGALRFQPAPANPAAPSNTAQPVRVPPPLDSDWPFPQTHPPRAATPYFPPPSPPPS